ncbi:hypothetical protein HanIR_Chr16g0836291 [Helianthus annuus]|nr:hypothetical protein HanIR_Chr16g0836291 [Helianthus annuus]
MLITMKVSDRVLSFKPSLKQTLRVICPKGFKVISAIPFMEVPEGWSLERSSSLNRLKNFSNMISMAAPVSMYALHVCKVPTRASTTRGPGRGSFFVGGKQTH